MTIDLTIEERQKLLLINVGEIQDLLNGAEESGDIEHQITCHAEGVPDLLRKYALIIEKIKERCSAQVWKYLEADPNFKI